MSACVLPSNSILPYCWRQSGRSQEARTGAGACPDCLFNPSNGVNSEVGYNYSAYLAYAAAFVSDAAYTTELASACDGVDQEGAIYVYGQDWAKKPFDIPYYQVRLCGPPLGAAASQCNAIYRFSDLNGPFKSHFEQIETLQCVWLLWCPVQGAPPLPNALTSLCGSLQAMKLQVLFSNKRSQLQLGKDSFHKMALFT